MFIACSGLGRATRGFETFATQLAGALRPLEGLDVKLLAGAGPPRPGQTVVPSLARSSPLSARLGRLVRDPPEIPGIREYVVEEVTFALSLIPLIWRDRPHVILTSDPHLGKVLIRLRTLLPRHTRLLFSNGAPLFGPFAGWDHVHHTTRETFDAALAAEPSPSRHTLLPYGITFPPADEMPDEAARLALRARLGLPTDRPILLSVGAMNAFHKRMDYVIRDLAQVPPPRPHLVILGDKSRAEEIEQLAHSELGRDHVTLRSVPLEMMMDYYDAADAFILASFTEGFGLVYVEALARGLTCVAHETPHTLDLFAGHGELADLSQPGKGTAAIVKALAHPPSLSERVGRATYARSAFSWDHLAPRYAEMVLDCARSSPWAPD